MKRHRRFVPRSAVVRASVKLAETRTDVVSISHTGLVVRVVYPLPVDSMWPLVVHAPGTSIKITGRVVRCDPCENGRYIVGLAFIDPSREARFAIAAICDTTKASSSRPESM